MDSKQRFEGEPIDACNGYVKQVGKYRIKKDVNEMINQANISLESIIPLLKIVGTYRIEWGM